MKRNLFAEITEGVDALQEARQGKRTLLTVEMKAETVTTIAEGGVSIPQWTGMRPGTLDR